MAGLGETRRAYHRKAVGNKLRELRLGRGWSQEYLAERLRIDRRQVLRLESGQAPVTLEVVEALAKAFEVVSLLFLASTVEGEDPESVDEPSMFKRLAEKEFGNVFGPKIDRPGMRYLALTAGLLTDDHLDALGQVADAFYNTQIVAHADLEEYSSVVDAFYPGVRPEQRKPRSRRTRMARD
jgi:transcriptional regulator with XRE-family HTH domain